MKLADYLKENKILKHAFAEQIGCAPSTISRLLSGKHVPDRETMTKIIEVTGGAVTPNDFFDLPKSATEAIGAAA